MSSATAAFRTGRLPEAQYQAQVERFWHLLGVDAAGQQFTAAPSAAAPAPPGASGQPAPARLPPQRSRAPATVGCPAGRPCPAPARGCR